MPQTDQTIGICLFKLAPKEEAVLKRVVTFSGAQGRNHIYTLTRLENAQVLVISEQLDAAALALKPAHAVVISIADQPDELPGDVLMLRPLLVTRVMRALDEARKLLAVNNSKTATTQVPDGVVAVEMPVAPVVSVVPAEPAIVAPAVAEVAAPPAQDLDAACTTEAAHVPTVPSDASGQIAEAVQEATYHHRALVVDDSAAIRKQLELELREAGIAADFAEDGEQALQKVSSGHHYDLIFLDIIMPGIDGYETCRQMRKISLLKKTPIIMLSAKTSPLDEVQGVIAGASTYLTKPVKSEQLQKTLQRVSKWLDNFNR